MMSGAGTGDSKGLDLDNAGWVLIGDSGLDAHLGPYRFRKTGSDAVYVLVPDARHLNLLGIVHGGTLMAFLDSVLGLEAKRQNDDVAMVTIQFDCSLIRAVQAGDMLCARATIVNRTRSLAFMRGEATVDGRVVASATGIWKRINPATIGQAS